MAWNAALKHTSSVLKRLSLVISNPNRTVRVWVQTFYDLIEVSSDIYL